MLTLADLRFGATKRETGAGEATTGEIGAADGTGAAGLVSEATTGDTGTAGLVSEATTGETGAAGLDDNPSQLVASDPEVAPSQSEEQASDEENSGEREPRQGAPCSFGKGRGKEPCISGDACSELAVVSLQLREPRRGEPCIYGKGRGKGRGKGPCIFGEASSGSEEENSGEQEPRLGEPCIFGKGRRKGRGKEPFISGNACSELAVASSQLQAPFAQTRRRITGKTCDAGSDALASAPSTHPCLLSTPDLVDFLTMPGAKDPSEKLFLEVSTDVGPLRENTRPGLSGHDLVPDGPRREVSCGLPR